MDSSFPHSANAIQATTATLRDLAAALVMEPDPEVKKDLMERISRVVPQDTHAVPIPMWNLAQIHSDCPALRRKAETAITQYVLRAAVQHPDVVFSGLLRMCGIHCGLVECAYALLPRVASCLRHAHLGEALEGFVPDVLSRVREDPAAALYVNAAVHILDIVGVRNQSEGLCRDIHSTCWGAYTSNSSRTDIKRGMARIWCVGLRRVRLFRETVAPLLLEAQRSHDLTALDRYLLWTDVFLVAGGAGCPLPPRDALPPCPSEWSGDGGAADMAPGTAAIGWELFSVVWSPDHSARYLVADDIDNNSNESGGGTAAEEAQVLDRLGTVVGVLLDTEKSTPTFVVVPLLRALISLLRSLPEFQQEDESKSDDDDGKPRAAVLQSVCEVHVRYNTAVDNAVRALASVLLFVTPQSIKSNVVQPRRRTLFLNAVRRALGQPSLDDHNQTERATPPLSPRAAQAKDTATANAVPATCPMTVRRLIQFAHPSVVLVHGVAHALVSSLTSPHTDVVPMRSSGVAGGMACRIFLERFVPMYKSGVIDVCDVTGRRTACTLSKLLCLLVHSEDAETREAALERLVWSPSRSILDVLTPLIATRGFDAEAAGGLASARLCVLSNNTARSSCALDWCLIGRGRLEECAATLSTLSFLDPSHDSRVLEATCTTLRILHANIPDGVVLPWRLELIDVMDILFGFLLNEDVSVGSMIVILDCIGTCLRGVAALQRSIAERWYMTLHAYLILCAERLEGVHDPSRVLPKFFPLSAVVTTQTLLEVSLPPSCVESIDATYRSAMSAASTLSGAFYDFCNGVMRCLGAVTACPVKDSSFCAISVPHSSSMVACIRALAGVVPASVTCGAIRSLFTAIFGVIPAATTRVPTCYTDAELARCWDPASGDFVPKAAPIIRPSDKVPNRITFLEAVRDIITQRVRGDLAEATTYTLFLAEMAWWDASVKSRAVALDTLDPSQAFCRTVARDILNDAATARLYSVEALSALVYMTTSVGLAQRAIARAAAAATPTNNSSIMCSPTAGRPDVPALLDVMRGAMAVTHVGALYRPLVSLVAVVDTQKKLSVLSDVSVALVDRVFVAAAIVQCGHLRIEGEQYDAERTALEDLVAAASTSAATPVALLVALRYLRCSLPQSCRALAELLEGTISAKLKEVNENNCSERKQRHCGRVTIPRGTQYSEACIPHVTLSAALTPSALTALVTSHGNGMLIIFARTYCCDVPEAASVLNTVLQVLSTCESAGRSAEAIRAIVEWLFTHSARVGAARGLSTRMLEQLTSYVHDVVATHQNSAGGADMPADMVRLLHGCLYYLTTSGTAVPEPLLFHACLVCLQDAGVMLPPVMVEEPTHLESYTSRLNLLMWLLWGDVIGFAGPSTTAPLTNAVRSPFRRMIPHRHAAVVPPSMPRHVLASRAASIVDELTFDGIDARNPRNTILVQYVVSHMKLKPSMATDIYIKYVSNMRNMVPLLHSKSPSISCRDSLALDSTEMRENNRLFVVTLRLCTSLLMRCSVAHPYNCFDFGVRDDTSTLYPHELSESTANASAHNRPLGVLLAKYSRMFPEGAGQCQPRVSYSPHEVEALFTAVGADLFTVWFSTVTAVMSSGSNVHPDIIHETLMSMCLVARRSRYWEGDAADTASDILYKLCDALDLTNLPSEASVAYWAGPWSLATMSIHAARSKPLTNRLSMVIHTVLLGQPATSTSLSNKSAANNVLCNNNHWGRLWGHAALQASLSSLNLQVSAKTVERLLAVGFLDGTKDWMDEVSSVASFVPLQLLRVVWCIALVDSRAEWDELRCTVTTQLWSRLGKVVVHSRAPSFRLLRRLHDGIQSMLIRYSMSHTQRDSISSAILEPDAFSEMEMELSSPCSGGAAMKPRSSSAFATDDVEARDDVFGNARNMVHLVTAAVILSTQLSPTRVENARALVCEMLKVVPCGWTTRSREMVCFLIAHLLCSVMEDADAENSIFLLVNKFMHDPVGTSPMIALTLPKLITLPAIDIIYDACEHNAVAGVRGLLWIAIHLMHSMHLKVPLVAFALPTHGSWVPGVPLDTVMGLLGRTAKALRGCPDQTTILSKLVALSEDVLKCIEERDRGGEAKDSVVASKLSICLSDDTEWERWRSLALGIQEAAAAGNMK
eukprot:PhM_4_TR13719/c0_g1_i1/m.29271